MNKLEIFTLKALRKIYGKLFSAKSEEYDRGVTDPDEASEMIYNLLASGKPCMVARFGAFELATLVNYLGVKKGTHSVWKYIQGKEPQWWWNKKLMRYMQSNAGFFPSTEENLMKFGDMMMEDIRDLDVLETWLKYEACLNKALEGCKKVTSEVTEPYFLKNPWSRILEGKKVLVVHPFADSIVKQYEKREKLFKNPKVLPQFELQVIKAVQSMGGNDNFEDWFEALDYMKKEISKRDFDICIIGCGAYGFPLAAHVKRIGRQAVHLAGVTQMLFGIKGARWEAENYSSKYDYKGLPNPYWIRPSKTEKPKMADGVENGCYW